MKVPVKAKPTKKSTSINDGIFEYVKLLSKCSSTVCCISYYWNKTESRFASFNEHSKTTSRSLQWFLFKTIKNALAIYEVVLALQLIFATGFRLHSDRPLIQPLMESLQIIAVGGCLFGRLMYSKYSLSFTNCFNSLITYLNKNRCKLYLCLPKFKNLILQQALC